jgi:hypothetical protein
MNIYRVFLTVVPLALFAPPTHAQAQRPCPSQYGVYYKSPAGWKILGQSKLDSTRAKQGDTTAAPNAAISKTPMKIKDRRPTFCIRQPVASLGTPDKPDAVVLIKFDNKKAREPLRNYSQDQVVATHLGRADEEGLFTITSTSDLTSGEYVILLGSENPGGYEFVVH